MEGNTQSDQFFTPNLEEVYLPLMGPDLLKFIRGICTAFVIKTVSLKFSDDQSCFEYAAFEVLADEHLKIISSASKDQLKEYVGTDVPEDIKSFIAKTVPISIYDKKNFSAVMLKKATLEVESGRKPEVEIISIAEDDRIHPRLRDLLSPDMNFVCSVPLFVNEYPIGVLWGMRKNRLEQTQKKEIAWQLESIHEAINNIVAQELERGRDTYFTKRLIEKVDATSQIYRRFYTTLAKQPLPIKSTIAHSYTFEKSYRLDTSFIIPTSNGFNISLKHYIPEEENDHNKVLLMIPGFFCNRSLMDRMAMEMCLRHGYKCYSLDMRGRSKYTLPDSGYVGGGWTIDDYIWQDYPAALRWIINRHPGQKIVVYGHSMGGMIAKFYASAYHQAGRFAEYSSLPDPYKYIDAIITITSPSYVDLKAQIPFFEVLKSFGRFIGTSPLADSMYQMISMGIISPFATVDLNHFFNFINNVFSSARIFSFNVGTSVPTVKDFIGYDQITSPEWYFFMENVFCEEAIKVIVQFARSLLNRNAFTSYDGKIDYTAEQANLHIPLMSIIGTKDTIAPPETIEYGFEFVKSAKKKKLEYDQGHLGIVFHPETVRLIGKETKTWLQQVYETPVVTN